MKHFSKPYRRGGLGPRLLTRRTSWPRNSGSRQLEAKGLIRHSSISHSVSNTHIRSNLIVSRERNEVKQKKGKDNHEEGRWRREREPLDWSEERLSDALTQYLK